MITLGHVTVILVIRVWWKTNYSRVLSLGSMFPDSQTERRNTCRRFRKDDEVQDTRDDVSSRKCPDSFRRITWSVPREHCSYTRHAAGPRCEDRRERYLMLRIVDGEDTRRWRASGVNDVGGATQGREVNTHQSLSLGRLSPVTWQAWQRGKQPYQYVWNQFLHHRPTYSTHPPPSPRTTFLHPNAAVCKWARETRAPSSTLASDRLLRRREKDRWQEWMSRLFFPLGLARKGPAAASLQWRPRKDSSRITPSTKIRNFFSSRASIPLQLCSRGFLRCPSCSKLHISTPSSPPPHLIQRQPTVEPVHAFAEFDFSYLWSSAVHQ